MQKQAAHLPEEADIGSGEKTPGEHDTEKLIEQVGNGHKQSESPAGDKPAEDAPRSK